MKQLTFLILLMVLILSCNEAESIELKQKSIETQLEEIIMTWSEASYNKNATVMRPLCYEVGDYYKLTENMINTWNEGNYNYYLYSNLEINDTIVTGHIEIGYSHTGNNLEITTGRFKTTFIFKENKWLLNNFNFEKY